MGFIIRHLGYLACNPLRKQWQEDGEFKASLGYIYIYTVFRVGMARRPCLKNKQVSQPVVFLTQHVECQFTMLVVDEHKISWIF